MVNDIYVEGVATGTAMLDMVMKKSDNTEVCRDKALFTQFARRIA